MDITSLGLKEVLILLSVVLGVSFLSIKFLIDYSNGLKKENEKEKTKNVASQFTSMVDKFDRDVRDLNKDINNLGSNLRGFKGVMEGFQNTIAQVGINHERISLRLQQLENYNVGIESRIREIVHHEILKIEKDSN